MSTAVAAERIVKTIAAGPATYKVADDGTGEVEAIVSTTNAVDSQGDLILPGAYSKFIAAVKAGTEDMPSVCWSHNWERVTGKTLEMEELMPGDPRLPADFLAAGRGALWVKYRYITECDDGRNAYALVKAGAIKQHSVGFMLDEDESGDQGKAYEYRDNIRYLKRIYPLLEHSDVIRGAAPGTRSTSVKALSERAQSRVAEAEAIAQIVTVKDGEPIDDSTEKAKPDDKPKCISCGGSGKCPDCDGSGWNKGDDTKAKAPQCSTCDDSGTIRDGKVTCPDCDAGKAKSDTENTEIKMPLPNLVGGEAMHNQAIRDALTAINTLIIQELQEGAAEYDCVIALCNIGNDIVGWAWREGGEYGDPPPGQMAAPPAPDPSDRPVSLSDVATTSASVEKAAAVAAPPIEPPTTETPAEEASPPDEAQFGQPERMPAWLLAGVSMALLDSESPVPDHAEPTEDLESMLSDFYEPRRIPHRGFWPPALPTTPPM